jgi:hypothetical protein
MSPGITKNHVEDVALAWLQDLGYTIKHGQESAPDSPTSERAQGAPRPGDINPADIAGADDPARGQRPGRLPMGALAPADCTLDG